MRAKNSFLVQRTATVLRYNLLIFIFVLIFQGIYGIMLTRVGGEVLPEYKVKCRECGKVYTANVNRNGLCTECKAIKTAESKHKYYNKRKANGGSLKKEPIFKICVDCGKEFDTTGTQTRCPECARKLIDNNKNKKRAEQTTTLSLRLPKHVHEELKTLASDNGLSLTSLILQSNEFYKTFLNLPLNAQNAIRLMIERMNTNYNKYEK